jgi:hypothetical protein
MYAGVSAQDLALLDVRPQPAARSPERRHYAACVDDAPADAPRPSVGAPPPLAGSRLRGLAARSRRLAAAAVEACAAAAAAVRRDPAKHAPAAALAVVGAAIVARAAAAGGQYRRGYREGVKDGLKWRQDLGVDQARALYAPAPPPPATPILFF